MAGFPLMPLQLMIIDPLVSKSCSTVCAVPPPGREYSGESGGNEAVASEWRENKKLKNM